MTQTSPGLTGALWARFRFSVVGALLSAPPPRGALKTAIHGLADKTWSHPTSGRDVRFSAVTIERWYYTARRGHDDPVAVLRRACAKTAARCLWPRRWPSGFSSSTASTRTGATNCTTTTSPLW